MLLFSPRFRGGFLSAVIFTTFEESSFCVTIFLRKPLLYHLNSFISSFELTNFFFAKGQINWSVYIRMLLTMTSKITSHCWKFWTFQTIFFMSRCPGLLLWITSVRMFFFESKISRQLYRKVFK